MRVIRPIHHVIAALPSQDRFYKLQSKYKGLSGPVGTGKTRALCYEALRAAQRNPGCTGFLGGPTYTQLHDVTIPTLVGILEEHQSPFRLWRGQRPRLLLQRPKVQILFRSTEHPDRLRGPNLAWFGIDELTYCKREAWQVLCERIRDPKAKAVEGFGVWTPRGFDWVYQLFINPKRRSPDYQAIQAGPKENLAVLRAHPRYYEDLRDQYDELFYRQEALGEYLNVFAGACYHAFREDRNTAPVVYEPQWGGLAWALDFNIDPMASLICQLKEQRRLEVLREITLRPGTPDSMCEAFIQAAQPYLMAWRATHGGQRLPVTVYGDASGHARSNVGKTSYAIIEQHFRDLGRDFELRLNANTANPPVVDRVGSVNALLCNALGQSRLLVHPDCKELITDFFEVSWQRDNQTAIEKRRDRHRTHWSDALGYLIYRDLRPDGFRRQIIPVDGPAYYK